MVHFAFKHFSYNNEWNNEYTRFSLDADLVCVALSQTRWHKLIWNFKELFWNIKSDSALSRIFLFWLSITQAQQKLNRGFGGSRGWSIKERKIWNRASSPCSLCCSVLHGNQALFLSKLSREDGGYYRLSSALLVMKRFSLCLVMDVWLISSAFALWPWPGTGVPPPSVLHLGSHLLCPH